MLSDAEKKEFEHLKEKIEMNKLYGIDIYLNKEQVKIIENLIKEIEELKNGQIDFWISDKELEKENKKLNILRLELLISQFPDTTETYKKYKKELDELLKEE